MNQQTTPRTLTPRGSIALPMYGEPSRTDELLRQIGRHWAEATGLKFAEYDQILAGQTVYAMAMPTDAGREHPAAGLIFGPSQPVEALDPTQIINIDCVCKAPRADQAMALCMSLHRVLRPSSEEGARGPFVYAPRYAALQGLCGVPFEMVDLWPAITINDQTVRAWSGWRIVTLNIASAPRLVGREGYNADGTAEAQMSVQIKAHPRNVVLGDGPISVSSTLDQPTVEVSATPAVGADGLPDAQLEFVVLGWVENGEPKSAVIDLAEAATVGELKTAIEANAGWTVTIDDPDELGIASWASWLLINTRRLPATSAAPAALRILNPPA